MQKFGKKTMSKIGKIPVILTEGVTAQISGNSVTVSGPKGSLTRSFPDEIGILLEKNILKVVSKSKNKKGNAIFGTSRALLANMVTGVTDGWKKELELVGAGYRAEVSGNTLVLTIGYSHPVKIQAPEGITFKVEKTVISVEGLDKEVVGQIAADVRSARPPEPYKGKGIKYLDEVVRRKPGKAAKAVGSPA